MADLVGDHVRGGEVPGRPEAARELVEEGEVEVHLVVRRAVERPGLRTEAVPQPDCVAVENDDDRRARVLLVGPREELLPRVLRVLGDELRELEDRVLGGRRAARRCPPRGPGRSRRARSRCRCRPPITLPPKTSAAITTSEEHPEPAAGLAHRDRQPAAAHHPALAATVLDVSLPRDLLPPHGPSLPRVTPVERPRRRDRVSGRPQAICPANR